ncbi:MAG: hypothetical protein ACOYLF_07680 [Blastocatellia bacterium]|jgi:hypothetical protein
MLEIQKKETRPFPAWIFFTDEGEVNRRNIFLLLLLLILLGNIDRIVK